MQTKAVSTSSKEWIQCDRYGIYSLVGFACVNMLLKRLTWKLQQIGAKNFSDFLKMEAFGGDYNGHFLQGFYILGSLLSNCRLKGLSDSENTAKCIFLADFVVILDEDWFHIGFKVGE